MDNTLTFTARSVEDPDRLATFTLQNGSVAVQLGDAIVEQVEKAIDTLDEEQQGKIRAWLRPAATGTTQAIIKPIPVNDFDAEISESGDFRTIAWIRAGGLRLAPVSMSWDEVDNPEGASAFVTELTRRQQEISATGKLPYLFDYWATWVFIGVSTLLIPLIIWRYLSGRDNMNDGQS